jgi:hypothetical protein
VNGGPGHAADPRRQRRGGSSDWRSGLPSRDLDPWCTGWGSPARRYDPLCRSCRGPQPLGQRAKGLQAVPSPRCSGGSVEERGAGCVVLMGRSFQSPPRSVRGPQTGLRGPTLRPPACKGTSAVWSRRHHHHPGVTTPGSTTSSSNNSDNRRQRTNNSRSGGRPASKVAGKSRTPSKCSPFFPRV